MEIKFIEKTKYRVLFELEGVDHTFCNMLKDELWKVDATKACSYRTKHPLVSLPTFIVETSKSKRISAKKVILEAIKNIKSKNKNFLKELKNL